MWNLSGQGIEPMCPPYWQGDSQLLDHQGLPQSRLVRRADIEILFYYNAQIKKSSESLLRGLSFHPEHSGGQLMDVRRRNGVIVLNSVCKVML